MLRILLVTLFAMQCHAGGVADYGGSYAAPIGPAVIQQAPLVGGYAAPAYPAPVAYDAAINTRRTVEVRPVAFQGDYAQPQIIDVAPEELPVQVHFRTASSRVNVHQSHQPGLPAQVEHAQFQDEPHRVIHEVIKPVIQEVREIIQPYRRVTQEIRPVIEEVHTVVHKGEGRRAGPGPILGPALKAVPVGYGPALAGGYKGKAAKAKA